MTDPRALLDAYAATVVDVGEFSRFYEDADGVQVWGMTTRGAAPKTFAALRAVLDLHPIGNPGVAAVAWCGGCGDVDTAPDWPCPTVQAITAALTCGDTL